MKLKNLFNLALLALAISVSGSLIAPSQSHAYLLFMAADGQTPANGPWANGINSIPFLQTAGYVGGCIITLPFCLLDQKVDGKATVSSTELAAQGYTNDQINQIHSDQTQTGQNLQAKGLKLEIHADDTKSSISEQVLSVNPQASAVYINFLVGSAGLK